MAHKICRQRRRQEQQQQLVPNIGFSPVDATVAAPWRGSSPSFRVEAPLEQAQSMALQLLLMAPTKTSANGIVLPCIIQKGYYTSRIIIQRVLYFSCITFRCYCTRGIIWEGYCTFSIIREECYPFSYNTWGGIKTQLEMAEVLVLLVFLSFFIL
jgi:hypothetical protein